MANLNYIWRGAVEPYQTQQAGFSGNTNYLWRGAVEPKITSTADAAAKLDGSSIFSIDISITGRLQEQTVTYLQYQNDETIELQNGSFLERWRRNSNRISGLLGNQINIVGVLS